MALEQSQRAGGGNVGGDQRSEVEAGEPATPMSPLVAAVGRRAIQRRLARRRALQGRSMPSASDPAEVTQVAEQGVASGGGALPHHEAIQRSFGHHDISSIRAHTGDRATGAAQAIGAEAYATGDDIAFAQAPDLHTAAHEAAHVVQQRAGVHLKGGVGAEGDEYERAADAVADRVVSGESAEDLLDQHAPPDAPGGGSRAVQRKLEYRAHYEVAPDAAEAVVKADRRNYEAYQKEFELKLGAGLFKHPEALSGANKLLELMRGAMTQAGLGDDEQHDAFGIEKAKAKPDLGSVLVQDVKEALQGGNLREKMGMVYQARFKISQALDHLRRDESPQSQELLGDEMKSEGMRDQIEQLQGQPKPKPSSYAILKRRDSIIAQNEQRKKGKHRAQLDEEQLEDQGIGLSEREKRSAKTSSVDGLRHFVPGEEFYRIPSSIRKTERDNLRRVVAGLSGSTDMYFHIAKHLKMSEGDRKRLRLAALGQMLPNHDHSFHEIMHAAKTQGELGDYSDKLPIGYTHLAPIADGDIPTVAGLQDFPGDAQVRDVGKLMTSDELKGAEGLEQGSFRSVLEKLSAYQANPSKAMLNVVDEAASDWLKSQGKKPHHSNDPSDWRDYERRAEVLRGLKEQIKRLLAANHQLEKVSGDQVSAFAQKSMADSDDGTTRMNRLGDLDGDHGDWESKDFRAKTTDFDIDTSNISIKQNTEIGLKQPLNNRDIKKDTKDAEAETRLVKEALEEMERGEVGPQPRVTQVEQRKRWVEKQNIRERSDYKENREDFVEMDTSILDALAPDAPVGGLLKRFAGKPVPQELEALQAYGQDGFYQMMNKVLNRRANKKFMASPKGQRWWTEEVPEEVKKLINLAVSAIRKMKPYEGAMVYRGDNQVPSVNRTFAKYPDDKAERQRCWELAVSSTLSFHQIVSAGKQPYSSYTTKKGKYTAHHIKAPKTAVDISAITGKPYEREVVFPPGTKFQVTQIEDRLGKDDERYGSRGDEAKLEDNSEPGRVKVTSEEA